MFVRVKRVRGRRYAYLVEGKREGTLVKQKVLRYLGPLARVANGIPEGTTGAGSTGRKERKALNASLRRIPLTFEELSEARRSRYFAAFEGRRQGFLTNGRRERVAGEEEALSILAAASFNRIFAEVGNGKYRMK